MKTFTATDARNRFGEFLDSGMVEGAKVVRNNRVLGYFVPEREYDEMKRAARAVRAGPAAIAADASPPLGDTLTLYSQGAISASEAKVELGCDRRRLLALLAEQGLPIPRLSPARTSKLAHAALAVAGLSPVNPSRSRKKPLG